MVLPLGASLSPGGSASLSLGGVGGVRVRERGGAILAIPGPRIPSVSVDGAVGLEATLMGLLFARLELEATLMGRLGTGVFGLATAVISSDGIAFADDAGTATADITPYRPEASDGALDALLDARLDGLRRVGSSGTTSVPDRDLFLDD